MNKVFVTGGTGFLGSHLLEHLIKEENISIRSIYRTEESLNRLYVEVPSIKQTDKIKWIKGDLFSESWNLDDINLVYHLAGFVGYKEEDRSVMEKVNVEGTKLVLEKIRLSTSKPKLIHLSSVVAVGAGLNPDMILDETSKFNVSKFDLGYFETKKKAEDLVFEYEKEHKLFALCLNPSTIYGPRDMNKSSRKGQLSMARGTLKFYPVGGVSIVHVNDVCEALIKASTLGESGERYILSGDNITIYDLLKQIAKISYQKPPRFKLSKVLLLSLGLLGTFLSKLKIKTGLSYEKMKVLTMYHWFNSKKAQDKLEFKPTSHLKCLEDSLNWAKEQGMLRRR